MVGALTRIKSYYDYGVFQPIQIAAIIALNECEDQTEAYRDVYRSRRDVLDRRARPRRVDRPGAPGDDVRLGGDPRAPPGRWVSGVRQAPPAGGERGGLARRRIWSGGRSALRFALVENEQRIRQATRGIKRALRA